MDNKTNLFEVTVRDSAGNESKQKINARSAQEAHQMFKKLYGAPNVPYLPKLIPI